LDTTSVLKLVQISFERPTRMLLTEPVVIFFTLWEADPQSEKDNYRFCEEHPCRALE
jgi:hypothetical protein